VSATVAELLPDAQANVVRFVRRRAGRLLAKESADDLVQSIHARALEHGVGCSFPSRAAFLSWLYKVAASHLADRHAYWAALRREPHRLLRITCGTAGKDDPGAVLEPVSDATGPGTRADRDEAARRADRALALLLPRDRAFVEWTVAGLPLEEQAQRLGISYTAARQSRHRALARLRDVFAALRGLGE
jgi:RNA polymerase sigma-70 factor (ECF subfamily)